MFGVNGKRLGVELASHFSVGNGALSEAGKGVRHLDVHVHAWFALRLRIHRHRYKVNTGSSHERRIRHPTDHRSPLIDVDISARI